MFEFIITSFSTNNKKQCFHLLSAFAEEKLNISQQDILTGILKQQQKNIVTGIGDGKAIISATVNNISAPVSILAIATQKIEYDEAIDRQPVDIIVLHLASEKHKIESLQKMAQIARFLRDEPMCESLRAAESEDAVRTMLPQLEKPATVKKVA